MPHLAHRILPWKASVSVAVCLGSLRCRFFHRRISPQMRWNSKSPFFKTMMSLTRLSKISSSKESVSRTSSKDHSFSIFSSHPETITRIKNIFCNEIIRSKQKSNYEQVHKIFDSKYQIFRNILSVITENDITFSSVKEMQRYVYNEADI